MKLNQLLEAIDHKEIRGPQNPDIRGIEFDSRKVETGTAFVAQRGIHADGHQFIPAAVKKGASAVFCEALPAELPGNVTFIVVPDSLSALGRLAAAYYRFPSRKMKVVGITGTNGKTSIVFLLYHLFMRMGYKTGLISTITYRINEKEEIASHTTPDALKIQQLMAEMAAAGCAYCFMEVSSHAVHQQRIAGIDFTGGVFTNITHDHLDYHKTFEAYIKAKKKFFDDLPVSAFALTNIDDKNGRVMVQNTKAEVKTYSTRAMADFRCRVMESHFSGMMLSLAEREVWTRFVGRFNAANLVAVYAVARMLEQNEEEVLTHISDLEPVKGRFETIRSADGRLAIVDYAHTPDALKNVLDAISGIRSGSEQVITVVGAGGDRDKTKRPEMAQEAVLASDKVILTSDNPRSEVPAQIIRDMETGIDASLKKKVISIENRREAIKTATHLARSGDIILIAGKGHETYQEVNGVRHHFDDVEEVKKCFEIND